MEYAIIPLLRYADFNGRARRREYWSFQALLAIVFLVLLAALAMSEFSPVASAVLGIFWIATLMPRVAVAIRRMHDLNWSAVWLFVPTVFPLLGLAVAALLFSEDGTKGRNLYGPDPKGRPSDPDAPEPVRLPRRVGA